VSALKNPMHVGHPLLILALDLGKW
jgi:hypothetical protein